MIENTIMATNREGRKAAVFNMTCAAGPGLYLTQAASSRVATSRVARRPPRPTLHHTFQRSMYVWPDDSVHIGGFSTRFSSNLHAILRKLHGYSYRDGPPD